jgi:hypothetical protein
MSRHKLGAVVLFEETEYGTYKKIGTTKPLPYAQALRAYSEIPNPASQLVAGDTEKEIREAILDIEGKMADIEWVNEYLEPYL